MRLIVLTLPFFQSIIRNGLTNQFLSLCRITAIDKKKRTINIIKSVFNVSCLKDKSISIRLQRIRAVRIQQQRKLNGYPVPIWSIKTN